MGVIKPSRLLGVVLKGASFGVYIIVWKLSKVEKLKNVRVVLTRRGIGGKVRCQKMPIPPQIQTVVGSGTPALGGGFERSMGWDPLGVYIIVWKL